MAKYLEDNLTYVHNMTGEAPVDNHVQRWCYSELMKSAKVSSRAALARGLANRMTTLRKIPTTVEMAEVCIENLVKSKGHLPCAVFVSVVRSICNAWTTTGRFSGPTAACPFSVVLSAGTPWDILWLARGSKESFAWPVPGLPLGLVVYTLRTFS